MVKGVIFDFNQTLYDPRRHQLSAGAMELLEGLREKKIPMCLVSKKMFVDRRKQITKLGLDSFFSEIIVVDKKAKEDFLQCARTMHLKPHEVLVVGDRVRVEVALGKSLSMKTVWYQAGTFSRQGPREAAERPDNVISDLVEVLQCFHSIKS